MTMENLIAVIANIYGINIVTRNKMKGALTRGEIDRARELMDNERHIKPEVQVILHTMLDRVLEREQAVAAEFAKTRR